MHMNKKILAELGFNMILNEATASTQTGSEILNKYKSHLMANEASCALVNNFVKEAQTTTETEVDDNKQVSETGNKTE